MAAITGGVFLGAQILTTAGIVFALLMGSVVAGWDEDLFTEYGDHISTISTIIAVIWIMAVFYYLDRGVKPEPALHPPPSPPVFEQDKEDKNGVFL